MVAAGKNGPFHFGLRGPVRTHRIDGDYGWHLRKGDCNLAGFFCVEDLATLVVSTFGTRPVRHLLFVTIRTLGKRVRSEKVVSAATRGASLRVPPFRIRHDLFLGFGPSIDTVKMGHAPSLPELRTGLFQLVLDVGQRCPAGIGRLLFARARLDIQIVSASGTDAAAAFAAHDP